MTSKSKQYLPFGTPIHGKHPYSEYAHLTMENRDFAVQITTPQIPSDPKFIVELVPPTPAPAKKIIAHEQPVGDGTSKPCIRPECKEVIRKIGEQQDKNQRERDHILGESKKLLNELDQTDQLLSIIENEQKQLTSDSTQLEKTLSQVGESLQSLDSRKQEQQQERDELNNKVMAFEAEKQRWTGRLQRSEESLADMLWKRDAAGKELEPDMPRRQSLIHFGPSRRAGTRRLSTSSTDSGTGAEKIKDKDVFRDANSLTDYSVLVRPDVLDYCELKRSITSFGNRHGIVLNTLGTEGNRRSGTGGLGASTSTSTRDLRSTGSSSVLSEYDMSASRTLSPSRAVSSGALATMRTRTPGMHRKRRTLTNPVDGSLLLDLPRGSFKGYTPSGSRRGGADEGTDAMSRTSLSMSSLSELSSASKWQTLDPVFYAESSRVLWGRSDRPGVVRLRHDPPGFRRKLLTAKGHPGIYSHGDFEEYSVDGKNLHSTSHGID